MFTIQALDTGFQLNTEMLDDIFVDRMMLVEERNCKWQRGGAGVFPRRVANLKLRPCSCFRHPRLGKKGPANQRLHISTLCESDLS
jgi:hypothetical protein